MSFAEDFNTSITTFAMGRQPRETYLKDMRDGVMTFASREKARPRRTLAQAYPEIFSLGACSLEHQHGRYRAFRRADGELLESHECKVEVIRRVERDGYYFSVE